MVPFSNWFSTFFQFYPWHPYLQPDPKQLWETYLSILPHPLVPSGRSLLINCFQHPQASWEKGTICLFLLSSIQLNFIPQGNGNRIDASISIQSKDGKLSCQRHCICKRNHALVHEVANLETNILCSMANLDLYFLRYTKSSNLGIQNPFIHMENLLVQTCNRMTLNYHNIHFAKVVKRVLVNKESHIIY